MSILKDFNWMEKLIWTAIGWHYGCKSQPKVFRVLLYPMGLISIPVGAMCLPWRHMVAPVGMPVPKFLLSKNQLNGVVHEQPT